MTLKTPILRSERHRRFVASCICCVCLHGKVVPTDQVRSQAAHVRFLGPHGTGLKPGDDCCLPMCVPHHDEHDGRVKGAQGEAFWEKYGLDPARIAAALVEMSPCKRMREAA